MSLPKVLVIVSVVIFGVIGFTALFNREDKTKTQQNTVLSYSQNNSPLEIALENDVRVAISPSTSSIPQNIQNHDQENLTQPITPIHSEKSLSNSTLVHEETRPKKIQTAETVIEHTTKVQTEKFQEQELPNSNRINELFTTDGPTLPIVETIIYKSRVPWQKGRPAWLSDYATHYSTSRHFIARSLNGKVDYLNQDVANGDKFNVFRKDKNFRFHLLVDISRAKMWFYYVDNDNNEKVLLKRYDVSLGRIDGSQTSGCLTPLGSFLLGNKIATYKPNVKGFHKGKQIEMVKVFGTRWIPFEKELSDCTAPAKGMGIHGVPWIAASSKSLTEDCSSIGKYESDGCIRLSTADVEELFAIIVTKPTTVEIVKDYFQNEGN